MKRILILAAAVVMGVASVVAAGAGRKKPEVLTVSPAELNARAMKRITTAQSNLTVTLERVRCARERAATGAELKVLLRDVTRRRNELKRAYEVGVGDFLAAADRNDLEGRYNLGVCYLYGYGVNRDPAKAVQQFERAADEGHPLSLGKLGLCLREGWGCEADAERSLECFKAGARVGDDQTQFGDAFCDLNYGLALVKGKGVAVDEQKGMMYLRRAADKGLVEAMDIYASQLMEDVGFEPTAHLAVTAESRHAAAEKDQAERDRRHRDAIGYWSHCARNLHYAPSMINLARCYRQGTVVKQSDRNAVYWYYRAAMDYNDRDAMLELAHCCDEGLAGLEPFTEFDRGDGRKERVRTGHWWRTRANALAGDRLARIWLSQHNPNLFDQLKLTAAEPAQP